MVTYSSTKKLLQNNFSMIDDLVYLQKTKVKLLDAYRMAVLHQEMGLTKDALERGFIIVVKCDQATGFTPNDKFMGININHTLSIIDNRLNELYKKQHKSRRIQA